jgi:putative glutamine amidotransferase
MSRGRAVPRVWVVASHREMLNEHGHPQCYTLVDEVSVRTLVNLGLQPVSYPRVPHERIAEMLETVDGIVLGGSATNVHPRHWGEQPLSPELTYDEAREAVALPLIRLAIESRVPVISFCRGSHEFNVCLGGSLHQSLKDLPQSVRHWEGEEESIDEQYVERHAVSCVAGGELQRMTGCERFGASSLHNQGVKRLGDGLVAEAHSDDGLVEAFRWHDASLFAWGFQFHPEWGYAQHRCYGRIMAAYIEACHAKAAERY